MINTQETQHEHRVENRILIIKIRTFRGQFSTCWSKTVNCYLIIDLASKSNQNYTYFVYYFSIHTNISHDYMQTRRDKNYKTKIGIGIDEIKTGNSCPEMQNIHFSLRVV